MGNFDLYGNNYRTREEAINAEMAQCNEIDNAINRREIEKLKRNQQPQNEYWEQLQRLQEHIQSLESRITLLESKTP